MPTIPTFGGARLLQTIGILSVAATFLVGGCGRQAGAKLQPQELAEVGKLPTVMILTRYSAEIRFTNMNANMPALADLLRAVRDAQQDGRLPTREAQFQAFWQELFGHFDRYVTPGHVVSTRTAEATMVGSGFFVTPDGYVVTNAHVVSESEENVRLMLARQGLNDIIEESLQQQVQDANQAWDQQPTDEMLEMAAQGIAAALAQTLEVGEVRQQVSAAIGATAPGAEATSKYYPAEVKKLGVPSPGKDVAILKIDQTNLPTLPIADDSDMRTGEAVYVIGYPDVATFHPFVSRAASMLEADMKEGLISARRPMPGGWSALEVSAAVTHGNSGGPALNQYGQVVGLATFISVDQKSGQAIQGFNFLVPASVITSTCAPRV